MKKEFDWFDKEENVALMKKLFYGSLILLVGVDFFIHKHVPFQWAGYYGFFVIYGLVSCYVIVYFSKLVGFWLKKKEDYYD